MKGFVVLLFMIVIAMPSLVNAAQDDNPVAVSVNVTAEVEEGQTVAVRRVRPLLRAVATPLRVVGVLKRSVLHRVERRQARRAHRRPVFHRRH